MSEYIEVGQPLQFTDPNTPTRAGEIVENVSDIYNIPSPRLGMQVFVKSEKKSFVITSLKNKVIGGVDVPEAAVEAFEPVGAKSFTWNNDTDPSNMNDFVVAGVYDIKGEHTRVDDNLPILNTGGGHSFNARLTVLDSSISGSGKDDDKCITQVLSFSNRLGQGEVYIRTGKGRTLDSLSWEQWSTLQRNVNVGEVGSLDDLKDNGIYSGVWLFGSLNNYPLTFVCVVINDYFIGVAPRRVSQFVYGLSKFDGSVVYQSRVWDDSKDKWSDWEILNQKEISSMITKEGERLTAYINSVVADAKRDILEGIDPEKIDSIKDIVAWIDAHGGDVQAIYNAIQGNTVKINEEVSRAEQAEQAINNKLDEEIERSVDADQDLLRGIDEETRRATEAEEAIKSKAVDADSLNFQARANEVALDYKTIEGVGDEITIPAATAESAGVMTAEDKVSLDSMPNEIEKIKDGDTIVGQAREIHSRNGKTVPDSFLVRTTAGSGTIGDGVASLKSVGGNIVKNLLPKISADDWNVHGNPTLVFDGNIAVLNGNGWSGIRTKEPFRLKLTASHKYYILAHICSNSETIIFYSIAGNTIGNKSVISGWNHVSIVVTNYDLEDYFRITPNTAFTNLCISNILAIDLTEMFGAGKEPSKEECDKLFGTMDALPQGLSIANPTEFKSTGFNQFNPDNVLEGKAIVDNAIVSGDKKIAVIPCLPCKVGTGENNGYCIHGEFGDDIKVYLTPLNPMEVDGELYMHELAKDATTDTYVPLIKGYMLVEVPTTANLCAHFLWSEDKCERDTYEPYFESKVELPTIPQMSEWGLAGIQSSGTLACDEIDFERGVYIKKIGSVDLGSLNWSYYLDKFLVASLVGAKDNTSMQAYSNCATSKYSNATPSEIYNLTQTGISLGSAGVLINGRVLINDQTYTDASSLKDSLQGVILYYELATPEEYPLPKVDNNYISSDYGVEQFDSVVPCNANNLYYMRSLAGETRNFLDRMYDNTAKADAKEVADYITNGIEGNKELATNAPNLALRALFVAAGAEYNDTGNVIMKTAPWGDSVEHLPKHYYLNGLGDITEEEMVDIYNAGVANGASMSSHYEGYNKLRTCLRRNPYYGYPRAIGGYDGINMNQSFQLCSAIEIIDVTSATIYVKSAICAFQDCRKLVRIYDILSLDKVSKSGLSNTFTGCSSLESVRIKNIKVDISFSASPNLNKESVVYMIQNTTPTSPITITLHADAYARLNPDLEGNEDIKSALEAQPLITLVSA